MKQKNEDTTPKKRRKRRSPEMMAELVLEAERTGNSAAICKREGISPQLFSRWKSKFKEAGIQGLKSTKTGPKKKDLEKLQLEKENARLREALCESSIELQLLKKSVNSD